MKKKDSVAFLQMAALYRDGEDGVLQSDTKALEMRIRAAELGNSEAYEKIGQHYYEGIAMEQDRSKAVAFYEVGAKKGSLVAHKNLARLIKISEDNMKKSIKHLKVAANAGDQESMGTLMELYKVKVLTKEGLAVTLREFQASMDEIKSKDRDDFRAMQATV